MTEPYPSFHVTLGDGTITHGFLFVNSQGQADPKGITRSPVQRMALKTTSGNPKYSDYTPPWTPVAQDDFEGGRGLDNYEDDITRFLDSWNVNSVFANKLFLSPQRHYCTGAHRKQNKNLPGSVEFKSLIGNYRYLANKFTVATGLGYTTEKVVVIIKKVGEPNGALTVHLTDDNAGEPGTSLGSDTLAAADVTDVLSIEFEADIATALSATSSYWVKVIGASGDDEANCWQVAVKASSGNTYGCSDDSSWASVSFDLYYRSKDAEISTPVIPFTYRYARYVVRGTSLFINGDRGFADSNAGALSTLVDGTRAWTDDEFAGASVEIISGTGLAEPNRSRRIVSNTATALTVDTPWTIQHSTDTEYVIRGANTWREITGHGLAANVTDVLVVNDIMYFCCGDATNIRRGAYPSGASTDAYATWIDDGTNKASFMKCVRDATAGLQIWKATAAGVVNLANAIVAWGTNLTFGTVEGTSQVTFKDSYGKITGLEEYGDDAKYLWVFREGSVFAIVSAKADEIPLREISTMMQYSNGRCHLVHNAYLYFNIGASLERYYSSTLTDVGVNRDSGLPTDRQGDVIALVGYPGRYFMAVQSPGYSSIFENNGLGWHEMYRCSSYGKAITGMAFDAVGGTCPDRLWIFEGKDIAYLEFPSNTLNPLNDTNMTYSHEGCLEMGFMYAGMVDVIKLFHSIKLFCEDLVVDKQWVEVDYKLDSDDTWTAISTPFTEMPVHEINLSETKLGLTAKRIRLRLRLYTNDNSKTPILKTAVVECVSRTPVKYSYGFTARIAEGDWDLYGEKQPDIIDVGEDLDEWAANATPLLMRCLTKARYDNKIVWLDPPNENPYKDITEGDVVKLVVTEL